MEPLQPANLRTSDSAVAVLSLKSACFSAFSCSLTLAVFNRPAQRAASDPGKSESCFSLGELGAGAFELLVELRRVDLSQQLASLDINADVDKPALR